MSRTPRFESFVNRVTNRRGHDKGGCEHHTQRLLRRAFLNQPAQFGEVDAVEIAAATDTLGRFEVHGDLRHVAVVHQVGETVDADMAFADVLVPVHVRVELGLAVVQMNGLELVAADVVVECLHRGAVVFGRFEGITGGENMAGVEANAHALGFLDAVDDRAEVFELPAEVGPLPCRCL
jgi:hypothetical protein